MSIETKRFSKSIIVIVAGLFLVSACATQMTAPDGADTARSKLTELQSNADLANRAQVEIKEAEAAVRAAEEPREDEELARHLVLIADHKVDTARARAQSRLYEDQRQALSEQSERARLEARTLEADRSRIDAEKARADAAAAREEADAAREEAEASRKRAAEARQMAEDLQREIVDLNARETDRGLVVTLGDLLFATGKSDLTGGAGANLNKLAEFLREYDDRTVTIEGHTDSVGSESFNNQLSQRRADAVKTYLVGQGVDSRRLTTSGLGEGTPVASNDTTTGRQQNRRVEVIISNISENSHPD